MPGGRSSARVRSSRAKSTSAEWGGPWAQGALSSGGRLRLALKAASMGEACQHREARPESAVAAAARPGRLTFLRSAGAGRHTRARNVLDPLRAGRPGHLMCACVRPALQSSTHAWRGSQSSHRQFLSFCPTPCSHAARQQPPFPHLPTAQPREVGHLAPQHLAEQARLPVHLRAMRRGRQGGCTSRGQRQWGQAEGSSRAPAVVAHPPTGSSRSRAAAVPAGTGRCIVAAVHEAAALALGAQALLLPASRGPPPGASPP